MYRPRREHFCSISTSWSMLSIKSTRVILRPAYCVSCSHRFRTPNNAVIGQSTSELRSLVGANAVRKCVDCANRLDRVHGNTKLCFACRIKRRRTRHSKSKSRVPSFKPEPKVSEHAHVTAQQIAAYLQAYAPAAYLKIVARIRVLKRISEPELIKEMSL